MQVKEEYGAPISVEQALTELVYPWSGEGGVIERAETDIRSVAKRAETDIRSLAKLVIKLAVLKGLTLAEINALAGYDRFKEV